MRLLTATLFFTVLFGLSFISEDSGPDTKGVYVISVVNMGDKPFKFPDDSIFVYNKSAVEKVLRMDETFLDNDRSNVKISLEKYYLIDFKKDLYKDIGKNLNKQSVNSEWMPIKAKQSGFNFSNVWYANEKYKITDTVYNAEKVKKIQYQNGKGAQYSVLMRINSSKNQVPVFFKGIEDRFKTDVLQIIISYPRQKGSWIYTKKFIALKDHEVLKAVEKSR